MSQLYQNALYGAVMILVVAVLRRALRDRLAPGARLCLWAACLFRLLTPAAPESALSFWGLSRLFAGEGKPAPTLVLTDYAPIAGAPAPASAPQSGPVISWETAGRAVWAAVGLALAVRYVLSWRRTRRAVACAIPIGRDDPWYALLPRCARLREGPMEGAPLTFGAIRPTVVLPPGLGREALDCVLTHEGVHAARRDNLWHYAMALALAVHWWNPAVWLMSRLLRRDVELSCDRAAVKKLGPDRRADYAQALVTLATRGSGPAFCQTFGRKAAEERILSIMKFKKTSIIGAALTLTLVLAVTAAFASEPKQPGYDGVKTSTSVSPGDKTPSDNAFTPLPDETRKIQSGFPEIDPDDVDLSEMKEMLDKKVADGQLTREEADQRLADTEAMLEQARRGELKLFWYDNGSGENWVCGAGVFITGGEMRSQFVDPGQVLQPLYYKDENGKLIPVDPDTVVSAYVLDSANPDLPTYVEEDAGKTVNDYNVKLPTFDEDGSPVNSGVIGREFYNYSFAADDGSVVGGAVRTSSGSYSQCGGRDCDVPYDHCHIDGKVVRVYYENPGLLCAHPDCDNHKPHQHDGTQYAGKAPNAYRILNPDLEPVPSAAPVSSGHHGENHHGSGHY